MSDEALFDMSATASSEEKAVEQLVNSLGDLTPAQFVKAELMRALARSISAGNRKGRSVAADVERLAELVHDLTGADETNDGLTATQKDLLDDLAQLPRISPAPARDSA